MAEPFSKADIRTWLQLDLGSVAFSLEELEQLAPGQTLLLTCDPDLPVELKCCGQPIGRARLVQVNGQLAIQVAQLQSSTVGGHGERVE